MILQRRMASSVYALLKSLERSRLERILNSEEELKPMEVDYEEIEDLEEAERWKKEEWELVTTARDLY